MAKLFIEAGQAPENVSFRGSERLKWFFSKLGSETKPIKY